MGDDWAHPHGEVHYIRRPGADRWIRLGEDEWRLLQTVRRQPYSTPADLMPYLPGWSAGDVAAALARFASLGLPEPKSREPLPAAESVRPGLWGLAGGVLLATVAFQVTAMLRTIPWQAWFTARPPGWLAVILVLCLAAAHEAGHILVAVACGHPIHALRVAVGRLGWMPIPTVRLEQFWALSRAGRTAVVLGGPGMQLLMAAVAGCLSLVLVRVGTSPPAVLLWLQAASMLLAAVNLLPVYPMDGYWWMVVRLDRPHLREESRIVRMSSDAAAVVLTGVFLLWVAGTFLIPR